MEVVVQCVVVDLAEHSARAEDRVIALIEECTKGLNECRRCALAGKRGGGQGLDRAGRLKCLNNCIRLRIYVRKLHFDVIDCICYL